MLKKTEINESSHKPLGKRRRKPRLRPNHHLMEPDEMTPDERWDRIVELLALMTLPEAPAVPGPEKEVLIDESGA